MKLVKVTKSDRIYVIDVEGHEEEIAKYGIDTCPINGIISKTRKAFRELVESYSDYDYAWKKDGTCVKYNWRMLEDSWLYMYHDDEFSAVEETEGFRLNDVKSATSGCLETAWDAVIFGDVFKFVVVDDEFLMIREVGENYDGEYDLDLSLIPEYVA